jgi:hypothetical protein
MTLNKLTDGPLGPPERHEGEEPRVLAADVQTIIRAKIPIENSGDASVALVAERAGVSTRTVYRVLQGTSTTIALDTADKLCIAADSHLFNCRLVWKDEEGRYTRVTSYW